MRELNVANHLLGDRTALEKRFDEDGYLFFRNIMDQGAVARLRHTYLSTLREMGVVDPDSDEAIWNGAPLDDFVERMKTLTMKEPWKAFRDDPAIKKCLRELLGEDYIWLPLIVYRVTPPGRSSEADREAKSRFRLAHQDGFFNDGMKFSICWMPLSEIDEDVGGIAIAEGVHKKGYLHDKSSPPMFDIPEGAIPDDAWCWTHFRPGDLLMLHDAMPHTGLTNESDRLFRMSMDFRLMPKSGDLPVIGKIISVDRDHISLCTEEDETVGLRVDDETFCRGKRGNAVVNQGWIRRDELDTHLKVGQGVIVTSRGGRAGLIRLFDVMHRA